MRVELFVGPHGDELGPISRGDADEDADLAPTGRVDPETGIGKCLARNLHQQSLLGIDAVRLPEGDPEEFRIEPIQIRHDTAMARVRPARDTGDGIVVSILRPPRSRKLRYRT